MIEGGVGVLCKYLYLTSEGQLQSACARRTSLSASFGDSTRGLHDALQLGSCGNNVCVNPERGLARTSASKTADAKSGQSTNHVCLSYVILDSFLPSLSGSGSLTVEDARVILSLVWEHSFISHLPSRSPRYLSSLSWFAAGSFISGSFQHSSKVDGQVVNYSLISEKKSYAFRFGRRRACYDTNHISIR